MERHDYRYDINCAGGGHGTANILWGTSEYFPRHNTSAILTSSDDGSDSGQLIKYFDVRAPGDIRMCAMPLADAETQPENNLLNQFRFTRSESLSAYTIRDLAVEILTQQYETSGKGEVAFRRIFGVPLYVLRENGEAPKDLRLLMDFHFPESKLSLKGRCFGNLLISACELICDDPQEGFEMYSRICKIQGEIVTVTADKRPVLRGVYDDGEIIEGESNIGNRHNMSDYNPNKNLVRVYHEGTLNPRASYLLKNSCLRITGLGSPETSVAPVLSTPGFSDALDEANRLGGRTIVIPPAMNSEGTNFKDAADVIDFYLSHMNGKGKRDIFTDVILSRTPIPVHGEKRYAEYGQKRIHQNSRGCQVLLPHARVHLIDNLLSYDISTGRIIHDPQILGRTLREIWMEV